MKQKTEDRRQKTDRLRRGSAIILAVVLTSLLAIIGVIFLFSARVDSTSSSAVADNEDLRLAVDSVISTISEDLALDVPGDPCNPQEYYDYPDVSNAWLASLEPSDSNVWPHITDLYNQLGGLAYNLTIGNVIYDHGDTAGNSMLPSTTFYADADGDGAPDSLWVQIPVKNSAKGKPIYAAVRIVDNGGMLNVNTGYKFDPCDPALNDGSSQMQINLMAMSWRPNFSLYDSNFESSLLADRAPANPLYFPGYESSAIWQYGNPVGNYTPFDISDELALRYRFVIDQCDVRTRLEYWGSQIPSIHREPFDNSNSYHGSNVPDNWSTFAYNNGFLDPNYDYRHIATTQNLDRIILPHLFDANAVRAPYNRKMLNINDPTITAADVYAVVKTALLEGGMPDVDADSKAAQLAVNLVDYVDADSNVTTLADEKGIPHFGFETPCIYISELAQNFFQPDACDPKIILKSYAIELFKPYAEDPYPVQDVNGNYSWQLVITNPVESIPIPFSWTGSGRFNVFINDDFNVIKVDFNDFEANNPSPLNGSIGVPQNVTLHWPDVPGATSYNIYFGTDQTEVSFASPNDLVVFMENVPASITTFDPHGQQSLLDVNTTYYWRIDPTIAGVTLTGIVWRFTVNIAAPLSSGLIVFDQGNMISLQRRVIDPISGLPIYIPVDTVFVPVSDTNTSSWLKTEVNSPSEPNVRYATHSFQRDISLNKPIRRLWDLRFGQIDFPTIGYDNYYVAPDLGVVQAHPANVPFTNVGQIGELFYRSTYDYGSILPSGITEPDLRINLAPPPYQPPGAVVPYQRLFNYLTVFDPTQHIIDPCGTETRIKGRININTAPWYVIAQLPWVSAHTPATWDLARSIVKYRDNFGPFKSTGELMNVGISIPDSDVNSIDFYNRQPAALASFSYLMPADQTDDEYERQNIIFTRLSNLVTVRSDIFTAYILVRIGADGPQKRFIAILDRSGVTPAGGKVKIVALQQVPDAR